MERKPPIYLWESGQFKGLRDRIFPLIFRNRPFVNVKIIDWARNLLIKKIGRLWGSTMGKVRGSKMIRYHRSLNHKLCRLGIGGRYNHDSVSLPFRGR